MKSFVSILILCLCLLLSPRLVAQSYTLSGTITDSRTGETLIGATVFEQRSGKGTVTNVNGRYSLTLKADSVSLKISFVGYAPQQQLINLDANRTLNFVLQPSMELQEVVITAERINDHRSSQMSAVEIPVEQLKSVPVLFGEADVVKAVQLMPGVQSGNEGGSGMYVRGGGPDENLFLLDGVPLYNVNHLGGFFSAFNADAVKNVTLYKGSFPARFGGRLSSVLDVTTNNGNDKEIHGNASIGFVSAKLNVEGPIVKEKTTFNLSARRTYADILLQPLVKRMAEADGSNLRAGYYFYDLNGKVTHKFNDRSRLYGAFYLGDDDVYLRVRTESSLSEDEFMNLDNYWGNMVASLRWNYELSPRLFANLTGSYTRYRNAIVVGVEKLATLPTGEENESSVDMTYNSSIHDATLRADFSFLPNPDHTVQFGLYATRHWFQPTVMKADVDYYDQIQMNAALQMDTTISDQQVTANEFVLYAEDDWTISPAIKINYGIHFSGFHVQNSFHPSLQPRLSTRWLITDQLSFKAGYAHMTQYLHLLSTTSISLPTDLWVPVTDRVAPMRAHQWAAGLFYQWAEVADFSIEGYYKNLDNLLEYKDGSTGFGTTTGWEDQVVAGQGWAYGVELLAQRSVGRLTGWVGYTWSRTTHRFDREGQMLNGGRSFPAKYDRRHDLSIVLSYKFSDRFDVSATWVFSTGNTATLAMQKYQVASDDPEDYTGEDNTFTYNSISHVTSRNNFRMPNYHRADVSLNFHRSFRRPNTHRTINVSCYNLYNHKNPYIIYQSSEYTYHGFSHALMQLSIFPILPSVAYTLYF
ncbi:MAG: carboxypeptidase-like regulatory domain-containing protein [Bacteroidales bacterium]|nr:carboxypeptidase-like regulatory domain-containing protein [Bacteroidales bacterium]